MSDAHGRFGLVDVLSAGAARAQGVDLEIFLFDDDIDFFGLRQHRDSGRRSVDTAGPFGVGHALNAMHARFEFQFGEGAAAADFGHDFLKAADGAGAFGNHLDF